MLIAFGLFIFSYSCKNRTANRQEDAIAITPRNTDITPANAYNDLFLDTSDVNKFITQQKLNDTLANRLRSFYNARNFQYAWFDSHGLNEQAYGFRSLYDYSVDTSENNKSLEYRLNAMMNGDSDSAASPRDANIVKTELQLTQRFITYFLNNGTDRSVEGLERAVPAKKEEIMKKAAAILNDKNRDAINNNYTALVKSLQQYVDIAKKGGWDTISVEKKKQYKKRVTAQR